MTKRLLSLVAFLCITISFSQTTSIPDAAFETYLETNGMGDGVANNGLVTTANISGVTNLDVRDEGITDLTGIEDFAALQDLRCDVNDLTFIDVSNNLNLFALRCDQNPNLVWINVKNDNNSNISNSDFRADNNASLYCIQVDDVTYSTSTWSKVDDNGVFSANSCARTYVPDDVFEAHLEAFGMGDGIANNDYVLTSNIESVTILNVTNLSINSLEGIEDFVALEELYCSQNSLTSLDVSNNLLLDTLYCNNNDLTVLDVSNNPIYLFDCGGNDLNTLVLKPGNEYYLFNIYYNKLTTLDISNISFSYLNCSNNLLETITLDNDTDIANSIDLSNNKFVNLDLSVLDFDTTPSWKNEFHTLDCSNNPLMETFKADYLNILFLNVLGNTALKSLECSNSELTSLNISTNTNLEWLYCQGNPSLGLPDISSNTNLTRIVANGNGISGAVDLSGFSDLQDVRLYDNNLSSLTIKNGNNSGLNLNFEINGNSNLLCVDVEVPSHFENSTNFSSQYNVDSGVLFSTDCAQTLGLENDVINSLSIEPNPVKNSFVLKGMDKTIDALTIYNIQGQKLLETFNYLNQDINISHLTNGLYIVKVQKDLNAKTFKILKVE